MWKFVSERRDSDGEEEKDDRPVAARRYVRLRAEELDRRRRRLAEDLQEQLSVSRDEADCMLRTGNWNLDAITNEWINNPSGAREKLGIGAAAAATAERKQDSSCSEEADRRTVRCLNPMCDNEDEPQPLDLARALGCGHWFCDDCWQMHLVAQIKSGPGSVFAPCMGLSCQKKGCRHNKAEENCRCQLLIPERWFVELLPGDKGPLAEAREKWLGWLRERYVEASKELQFCPLPGCGRVIADVEGHGMPAQVGSAITWSSLWVPVCRLLFVFFGCPLTCTLSPLSCVGWCVCVSCRVIQCANMGQDCDVETPPFNLSCLIFVCACGLSSPDFLFSSNPPSHSLSPGSSNPPPVPVVRVWPPVLLQVLPGRPPAGPM